MADRSPGHMGAGRCPCRIRDRGLMYTFAWLAKCWRRAIAAFGAWHATRCRAGAAFSLLTVVPRCETLVSLRRALGSQLVDCNN